MYNVRIVEFWSLVRISPPLELLNARDIGFLLLIISDKVKGVALIVLEGSLI